MSAAYSSGEDQKVVVAADNIAMTKYNDNEINLNSILKELNLDEELNKQQKTIIKKTSESSENNQKNTNSKLPAVNETIEHSISLDHHSSSSLKKSSKKHLVKDAACPTNLPCIPMYNKYVMKLDRDDKTLEKSKTFAKKLSTYDELKHLTDNKLPSLDVFVNKNFIPLDVQDPILKQKSSNNSLGSSLDSSPFIADLLSKGVFVVEDQPTLPELPKENEDLKDLSTDDLIDRQQKLYKIINVTGDFVFAFSQAEDKEAFIKSLGLTKANGIIDSNLNKYLKAYDGVNAELASRLTITKGNWRLQPEGKILFPLLSTPKSMTFVQSGLTTGTVNRKIAHLGIGERIYPFAKSFEDLGNDMFGVNLVIDKDISRKHMRGSIGFEYMHNSLKIISNIYRRLSAWRDSPDFEKGYVEERAASGWDLFVEYWFKSKFAIKTGITHWIGRDISPFGDTNEKNLENSPYVYEVGIKYNPVPAISLEMSHQRTAKNNSNTLFGLNFNVPLGDNFSFSEAFNPDALNKASGNSIATSRSMFIERDYTMPLQYRSKPGMYYIRFINQPGPNKYLFIVEDGFHRPAPNVPVTVKASHPSIKLSNNGFYISNAGGYFVVEIIQSAVTKATLSVTAGSCTEHFEVEIQHLSYKMKADPIKFERFENSRVTVFIDTDDMNGIEGTDVKWRIKKDQPGTLDILDNKILNDGTASVIYNPDTNQTQAYDVDVIATIYEVDFPITLHVVIYGNGEHDFGVSTHEIDGGNYATLTYENLKPNTTVDMTAIGVCQLQTEQPEGPMEMTGTTTEGQKITVPVDENGVATAYAVGSTVVGDSGLCKVTTKTLDPYLNNESAKADITSRVYDAQWEVPNAVLYLEPFTATLKNLKNDTNVEFSALNDTASINTFSTFSSLSRSSSLSSLRQPGRAVMRMAAAPNDLNATKNVTVANNQASNDYLVTGDYSIEQVDGIHAKYYHDAYNTRTDTDASTLAITQFTPFFIIDTENQRKLDLFSGDDTFVVKLTAGQPHRNIFIRNDENNVTITAPETFNEAGEAEITIQGKDLRSEDLFSITANAMGKEAYLRDAVTGGILKYHIFKPNIVSSQGVSGENITDTALISGAPKFKNLDNTIDYKTDYKIVIGGLLPNTPVNVTSEDTTITNHDSIANDQGQVTITLGRVTNGNISNVTLHVNHQLNSVPSSSTITDFNFKLYKYNLSISSASDSIIADSSTQVTVSGGRPGDSVTWSISGSGEFTGSKDATFNSSGKAYATVKGISPFTNSINIVATQLLSNSISKALNIKNYEKFNFSAYSAGSNLYTGYSKDYVYTQNLSASHKYVKHVIVKFSGSANDYATINLNLGGNNYNYRSNASYWINHGSCYSSVNDDNDFVDFVNYNLDQNVTFYNNQLNIKITQHGTCELWTDISVQGSILVQYK